MTDPRPVHVAEAETGYTREQVERLPEHELWLLAGRCPAPLSESDPERCLACLAYELGVRRMLSAEPGASEWIAIVLSRTADDFKPEAAPDANCLTLPDGSCVSDDDCMHGPAPVDKPMEGGKFIDWPIRRRLMRQLAVAVLVAHQRRDDESCLCGWAELGRSHPEHVVTVLEAAGALRVRPESKRRDVDES